MMSFQVKTTSSAVSGSPSLQRTPWRSLKVHVFWSGATDHDSASPGPGCCVAQSRLTSGAKSRRMTASDAPSKATEGIECLWTGAGGDHKTPARLAGVAFGNERGRRQRMGGAGPGAAGLPQPASASACEQCDARKGRRSHRNALLIPDSSGASKGAAFRALKTRRSVASPSGSLWAFRMHDFRASAACSLGVR